MPRDRHWILARSVRSTRQAELLHKASGAPKVSVGQPKVSAVELKPSVGPAEQAVPVRQPPVRMLATIIRTTEPEGFAGRHRSTAAS